MLMYTDSAKYILPENLQGNIHVHWLMKPHHTLFVCLQISKQHRVNG